MSKERRVRREERERQAAQAAAAREAAATRRARREAVVGSVQKVLPQRHSRQTGLLAQRRRKELLGTFALLLVLNVLVVAFSDTWAPRALALCLSALGAPVLHTLLFRRT